MTKMIDPAYKNNLDALADSVIKKDTKKEIQPLRAITSEIAEELRARTIAVAFFTSSDNSHFSNLCNRLIKDGIIEEDVAELLLSRFNTAVANFRSQQTDRQ